jgi:hypothetical protein
MKILGRAGLVRAASNVLDMFHVKPPEKRFCASEIYRTEITLVFQACGKAAPLRRGERRRNQRMQPAG